MERQYFAITYKKDKSLVQQTRGAGLNVENPFKHTEAKRELLRAYGYNNLFGQGGKRIPIERCTDRRVGDAFGKLYRTAKGRLEKLSEVDKMTLDMGAPVILR